MQAAPEQQPITHQPTAQEPIAQKQSEPPATPWRTFLHRLAEFWEQFACWMSNTRRAMLRGHQADYAVIRLDHALSERTPDLPWYYAYLPGVKVPLSLEYLHDALERIARDPDLRGVIFLLKGPSLSLSQAQSMNALFARFRRWDREYRHPGAPAKQIIAHMEQAGAAPYLLAAAADRVTMPPLTTWDVLGLRVAPTYWKETLQRVGVQFDVVKVAPWKTAADTYIRSDMSEAARDQYDWLLDSLLEDIVSAITQGRHLSAAQVRALIDQAPLTAEQALAAGLIDDIAYEDQLPDLLKPQAASDPLQTVKPSGAEAARLKPYARIRGRLYRHPRPVVRGRVGVLSVSGTMIVGQSRSFPLPLPLVGDDLMGSETVIQEIRAARQDQRIKAVVLNIDSGGGSALASDLIWRELKLLDQEKPLIVYMGNTAASGGYYIATPGRKIIAQSATLTGSIGVVIAKAVTKEMRAKIGANREVIRRGDHAGIYTDDDVWTPDQHAKVKEQLLSVYDTFKQRVAEARLLPFDAIDEIANGRVWTGRQALAHGLVDVLGDFEIALQTACRAANLPDDGTVRVQHITPPSERILGQPGKAAHAAWQRVNGQGFGEWATVLLQGEWLRLVTRDPVWFIPPDLPRIE